LAAVPYIFAMGCLLCKCKAQTTVGSALGGAICSLCKDGGNRMFFLKFSFSFFFIIYILTKILFLMMVNAFQDGAATVVLTIIPGHHN